VEKLIEVEGKMDAEQYCKILEEGLVESVTTLILNEYRQSSNSSVQAFEFLVSGTTQNAYC
jgi:hypothetical protein